MTLCMTGRQAALGHAWRFESFDACGVGGAVSAPLESAIAARGTPVGADCLLSTQETAIILPDDASGGEFPVQCREKLASMPL
jgi:hypothetical protein